jgi:hypothetical protein
LLFENPLSPLSLSLLSLSLSLTHTHSLNLPPNGLFLLHPRCGEAAFVYFPAFYAEVAVVQDGIFVVGVVVVRVGVVAVGVGVIGVELLKYRIPCYGESCDKLSQCVSKILFRNLNYRILMILLNIVVLQNLLFLKSK